MIICEYCHAKWHGSLPDAFDQGWGHLRFQKNLDGRIINYCPAHRDEAHAEMFPICIKVLTGNPIQGDNHAPQR